MLRSFLVMTCACCIVAGAHPTLGQEAAPPTTEEAASAPALEPEATTTSADMVPTPPEELTLRYGGELGSDINLQEEININLIDLDALRVRLSESVADQQFNISL